MRPLLTIITKITLFGLITGCGVEAGNPDSSEEKPAKFSLKLTETPTTGLNNFYVDVKSITVGDSQTITFGDFTTIDVLTLGNGQTTTVVDQIDIAAGGLAKIVVGLADTEHPVRAVSSENVQQKVVVLKDGEKTNSLEFTGGMNLGSDQNVTAIVDIDLRYTLSNLDETTRDQYNVESDVIYALNHKHTFFQDSSRAMVRFSQKTSGELLCITEATRYTASNLPQECVPNGTDIIKGVFADAEGNAVVISVPNGDYDVWGIMGGSVTSYRQNIQMNGGDTITVD